MFHPQGEILGLRMAMDEDTQMEDEAGLIPGLGELTFDDGGMRGLAAALCWVGLVYRCSNESKEALCHPSVIALARSLLQLPTMRKSQSSDMMSEQIRRIIRQNVESKKMAITSFEWAEILRNMNKQGQPTSVQDAIDCYNKSPEVAAHGGSGSKEGCQQFVHTSQKILSFKMVQLL